MNPRPLQPLVLACACLLAGCAIGPNPRDPYEGFNRKVFAFNDGLDKAVLKPAAKGYDKVMPEFARHGVTNFFNNLGVVVTTFNDAVQLKGKKVPVDIARFATNLTFGIFGLIDVATELRIENRNEDFGQSLGYWGVGSGPYIVLPFFGPSTVRDGAGLAVDYVVSPFYCWEDHTRVRWEVLAVNIVNTRANLLPAEKILDETGVERYTFLRDVYLQRREYLIHDGNPPVSGTGPRPKSLRELEEEDMQDEPVKK
ncbi:MAG TPA: VacJ family lipoprotein [Burkholderiales bacterium]|nr:VacJ family lipoprotein [Burkholderiales bacterium]